MKRKRKNDLSIFAGKWPLVYTGVVLMLGIMVAVGIVYMLSGTKEVSEEMQLAMVVAVLLVIVALAICFSILRIRNETKQLQLSYYSLKEAYEGTNDLNNTLRGQRHDFLNHLQIVHSLIEMNDYEEASEYMEKIYSEIQAVGKILKTSSPAINALLQVKNHSCEEKNIEFKIMSTTRIEDPAMEPWDICGILGNLIDNAIHAAGKNEKGKILVSLKEDIKNYIFKVKDNGSGIPPEIAKRIFDMGFTTKGNEGQGIGLAVSKKKLKVYNGDIKFITGKKGTIFTFTIPRAI